MTNYATPGARFLWPALVWLLVSYGTVICLPNAFLVRITQEDSLFENLTCVGFFAAAALFGYLYFADSEGNDFYFFRLRRNVFYLLLGLLFFFCGGEEISWGQRIFHTEASGFFATNLQHETTLHNMPGLVRGYYNSQGKWVEQPGGLGARLFSQENLMNLFNYSWGVLVPLTAIFNLRLRRFWQRLNVPVVPLLLGLLLVLNNAMLHVARLFLPGNNEVTGVKIVEVKECNIALFFFTIGLWFVLAKQCFVPTKLPAMPPALAPAR